ncbi:MAG TPA: hypothetical protein VFF04_02145 [Candidatus Babeliales bacterium]|nr:hypothetical protein [Candidatus Babeliales bacterium]
MNMYWLVSFMVMQCFIINASDHLASLPMDSLCTHMKAAFGDTFHQLPQIISTYKLSKEDRKKLVQNHWVGQLAEDISAAICVRSLQKFRELDEQHRKNNAALVGILNCALTEELEHRLAAKAKS